MASLESLKEQIKKEASEQPEKFFATEVLREEGFSRGRCDSCGMYFWALDEEREVCGEPECSGGYTFINDSPTSRELSYVEAWEEYRDFMTSRGYQAIDRYPVVARWRDDEEFVGGSIYNFQPHVVSGEAEPPAPELVVPQPSLRFNDVDNVGVTGRHYVLHDHIGQTCFRPPEDYDRDRYFRDMFDFAVKVLEIPKQKLILHEEAWGGGGNLGPCMEFFVDGLELWNQVYMLYEQTPEGYEELDLQVLDMGMGHERITWISHGTETSYECVMPETLEKMKERTGIRIDQEVWEKFLPHSSELNIDEVEDVEEKWKEIADRVDEDVKDLKNAIKPAAALYSVAEHARALLFPLADGMIPSNSGGGHNLRMIYRRARDFIESYGWDLDMVEVARWNAEELEPMFPELLEAMNQIEEILDVEDEKYEKSRKKAREKLEQLEGQPSIEEMVELYESHGVSPEMMEEHGFKVPEDFYSRLGEGEETVREADQKFDLEDLEETEKLYYRRREPYRSDGEPDHFSFTARIEGVIDDWIVLDRTMFYPEGGGQMHDVGKINNLQVEDVQKQGSVVLHRVPGHGLKEGKKVKGVVNGPKRKQLTQHHSATHMVNAAAREELGSHIYQAGARKTLEKARLDITHYEKLSRDDLESIEEKVREIIDENHHINVLEMQKSEAEQEHGFRIYQGGAPPGNIIRLIEIEGIDIEACGGTHLTQTSHAEDFYITGSTRIQDGVIRLEYVAGEAAREYIDQVKRRLDTLAEKLGSPIPGDRREVERELCDIFSVEPGQLVDTVERFSQENEELIAQGRRLSEYMEEDFEPERASGDNLVERAEGLYRSWKQNEKKLEEKESRLEDFLSEKLEDRELEEHVPTGNIGLLIQIARELAKDYQASITLIGREGAVSASYHEDFDADENLKEYSDSVQGDQNFAKAFDI